MEEVLTYTTFFIEVAILNYLNYRIYKTFLTPIACLSIPFTIVLLVCLLCNEYIGFIPFHYEALWVWIVGLFFFGIPTFFFLCKHDYNKIKGSCVCNSLIVKVIVLLSILYMFTQLNALSEYDVGSKELGEEIAIGGLNGRISNILLAACPFVVCTKYNKFLKCVIAVSMFYFLFALGSKTWILYAAIACALCLNRKGKITFNLWYLLLVLIGMLLIFGIYYASNTDIDITDFEHFFNFISRHFYFYLTSGLLPLSEFIYKGTSQETGDFVLPFINIIDVWLGNSGNLAHSPIWYTTDNVLGTQSNVFTFFGSLYMGNNQLMFCLYCFLFGLMSYYINQVSMRSNKLFFHTMNAYNLCVLFFGWFNCGYALLRIWEILLILLFFDFISKKCFSISL